MNTMVTFDTHKFIKRLEAAGMPTEHAEAIVEAQRSSLSESLETSLATKADVTHLGGKIDLLEAKVDAKFDKMYWMIGALITLAVANFAKQFF